MAREKKRGKGRKNEFGRAIRKVNRKYTRGVSIDLVALQGEVNVLIFCVGFVGII